MTRANEREKQSICAPADLSQALAFKKRKIRKFLSREGSS